MCFFFFSSRRRHTRWPRDWSSDVCSSDLGPNDFRLNIESTIAPSALHALASPNLDEFLRDWEWQRPPTIHLAIEGSDHHPENWRGDGNVALDRTRFRGVWMNGGNT